MGEGRHERKVMRKALGYAFAIAFFIAGWWITALVLDTPALPAPPETFAVLAANMAGLLPDLWVSFYRVTLSIIIGTVIAVPIAMVCSRSPRADALFAPVLYIMYPIPKIVILPILLVILGLADAPKIVLISLTVFFQVLVTVRDAVHAVPEDTIDAARTLGVSRKGIYTRVILPSIAPGIFTSLRVGTGTAIAVLFFAEAIAGSTGLGYFIMQSWAMVDYTRMFAGIIALALLGVALYVVFDIAERRLTRWRRAI